MQLRDRWPADTIGGGCFVSLRHEIPAGEQIIDLDRDLEGMPPWGRLCILPEAVRQMNVLLGWTVDNEAQDKLKKLRTTNAALRSELDLFRGALEAMVKAAHAAGIDVVAIAMDAGIEMVQP